MLTIESFSLFSRLKPFCEIQFVFFNSIKITRCTPSTLTLVDCSTFSRYCSSWKFLLYSYFLIVLNNKINEITLNYIITAAKWLPWSIKSCNNNSFSLIINRNICLLIHQNLSNIKYRFINWNIYTRLHLIHKTLYLSFGIHALVQ